jgi:hypothetical protein
MKKITLALVLATAALTQVFAAATVRAEVAPENMNQGLAYFHPDVRDVPLKPLPLIDPTILLVKRAELTSQLFVVNTNSPGVKVVWCLVRNTGFLGSGPCWTYLRIHRAGTSVPLQGYVATNVPAGSQQWIGVAVYAPYGFTYLYSEADATHIVPEYLETNNWDSIP